MTEELSQNNTVDDIINDMIDDIPEIQPHVVNNVKEEKTSSFNPSVHATDENGNPKLTKTGKYRKKKVSGINNPYAEKIADPIETHSLAAAEVVQGLKRSSYHNFLGHQYGDDRHKLYVNATKDYFVSKGGVTLTPLHTILILEGALLLEAMAQEKARSKILSIKEWVAKKYVSIKFGRKKRGAQHNNRPDDEREDDTGEVAPTTKKKKDWKTYIGA